MKKSQSALEFLTTYGWAFLVILIMIGALAYFGILNPSRYLPDRATATSGFNVREFRMVSAAQGPDPGIGFTVILENKQGSDINIQGTPPHRFASNSIVGSGQIEDSPSINEDCRYTRLSDGTVLNNQDSIFPADDAVRIECIISGREIPTIRNKAKIYFELSYVPVGKTIPNSMNMELFGIINE
jgi:hypothetical protein